MLSLIWNCLNSEKIQVFEVSFAQDVHAGIAVGEVSRYGKRCLIEPRADRGITELAGADAIGPLAADTCVRDVA